MALIKGHDYVTIKQWQCPYCKHMWYDHVNVGRFFGSNLTCQNCAMNLHYLKAENVEYAE